MKSDDQTTLESLIDSYGLAAVMGSLSDICREKAEHLRTNWQDEPTGRAWDRAAGACERAASSAPVVDISP